ATDPDTAHPQIGFADRQIKIGDLAIFGRRLEADAWRTAATPFKEWYLEVRNGDGLITIVPEASALPLLTAIHKAEAVIILLDEDLDILPPTLSGTTIAAPADAAGFDEMDRDGDRPIRLFCDAPVSFALPGSGVTRPGAG
ncbi:MAG TPA: hypothetical protein VGR22_05055, partial [Thermomicrobiales bacterium]|nr:hypothetical protein [Thermomicrobiales bacterium]